MKIKTDSKKTIKSYKHPNESEKYYNKLLTLGAQELDKKAGVYGICINGVTIYVGQSLNLLRRLADHLYWMCKWNDEMWWERQQEIDQYRQQCLESFFKYFTKYFHSLWI